MEDADQGLQGFQWSKAALEDPIIMQFHSDESFAKDRLLCELEVFLLAAVHEFGVFTLSFQDLFHILHIDSFVFSRILLLFSERTLVEFALILRLELINSHTAVLDWFGHDALTISFQFS